MISVLLPSRKRTKLLLRCLRSLADNATPKNFEVCLRIHRDDTETLAALPEILSLCTVRVVIGLQHEGYKNLAWFYQEAAAIARGDYVWVMNDDCVVKTNGWDEVFLKHSQTVQNTILMPHKLTAGGSTYLNNPCNPFMFLPNKCWEKCGQPRFSNQFDAALWSLLRNHGWNTDFPDVEIEHDRDPQRTAQDRQNEVSASYNSDPHESHMENL